LSRNKKDETILNEDILRVAKEVRCLSDDGEQYGIISSEEALEIADNNGLDLVLIAPNGKPPVAKVMDYGKFKYQEEKKKKEARKKQKQIDVKEIKLSVKIADNDINYKVKHAIEFLEAEKHVKFRVFLKGREMSNPQAGVDILKRVFEMVKHVGSYEKEPKLEGRYVNLYVTPINSSSKN
jgi:translation initiation factor IF-3